MIIYMTEVNFSLFTRQGSCSEIVVYTKIEKLCPSKKKHKEKHNTNTHINPGPGISIFKKNQSTKKLVEDTRLGQ